MSLKDLPRKARRAAYIYASALAGHTYGESHPMKPIRLQYTFELAKAAGFLSGSQSRVAEPRPATDEELRLFHEPDYIAAVKALGAGLSISDEFAYGFGPGDNPVTPGMFEAHSLAAGGTMVAAELVRDGTVDAVFNPAGGLHHALPRRASGFCIFNDPVLAIRRLVEHDMRVAYVDIDCHHGDGVQYAFYDTSRVMTISLHESGRFLFPGTGDVNESGVGDGEGYSVNVPLAPYTDDEIYSFAFDEVVPPLVRAFKPDVLFTQLGIDTHYGDPITHLRLTTQGFASTVAKLAAMGDECGKWIAAGGGGYDLSAVARGWSMAYAIMCGAEIPERLPAGYRRPDGPGTFADPPDEGRDVALDEDIRSQIRGFAEYSVQEVKRRIFPKHGL
ncbi:MAG: acetoin utilization protein AcuC [Chloroflexi bacterium]|nr:acetoin utilization protein AcuC [Chloroflexota bacterium]